MMTDEFAEFDFSDMAEMLGQTPIPNVEPNGDQPPRDGPEVDIRAHLGGDWILDAPPGIPAAWGSDDDVIWALGEALIVAGPAGVGKTTIAAQLVWARLGLLPEVLGYPVTPTSSRVLYLAMDRPRQIQRALRRLATETDRKLLNERLVARPGPPPRDLAKHPEILAYLANTVAADTVIIDSLKDAAIGLADDEVGAGLNRAMQICLAGGIEVAALHHQRKGTDGHKPKTLEDLYGSTWIAAGAGSVILLWGQPGDHLVELIHLKQPGALVGPLKIEHDHAAGTSSVQDGFDILRFLRGRPHGVTIEETARAWQGHDPSSNERKGALRKLNGLAARGLAHKIEGSRGGTGGSDRARWYAIEHRHEAPE